MATLHFGSSQPLVPAGFYGDRICGQPAYDEGDGGRQHYEQVNQRIAGQGGDEHSVVLLLFSDRCQGFRDGERQPVYLAEEVRSASLRICRTISAGAIFGSSSVAMTSLRAVEGQIAGRADKGQEGGYDPFSGQLQDLYASYGGGADAEGDQF
jgi:hypothetical protein